MVKPKPAVFWVVHLDSNQVPFLPEVAVDVATAEALLPLFERCAAGAHRVRALAGNEVVFMLEAIVGMEESTPGSRQWHEEQDNEARRREDGWGS